MEYNYLTHWVISYLKIKCKYGHDNKKNMERAEVKTKIVSAVLNKPVFKMIL